MNPAEDTQFVAQLAQFSQLEFTQNSTAAISQLATSMQNSMETQALHAQSITNASATPLINKMVRVMEESFEYSGAKGKDINIHLTEGNKNARVLIKNSDGDVVADLGVSADSSKGGDGVVKWDGKDPETGNQYLGGKYTIEVLSPSGQKIAGYAYSEGVVTGVNFSTNGAALTINGKQYGLGYLVNVEDYEAPPKKADDKKEEKEPEHVAGGGFD
jgi:flagellar basal-body rod modification protein FlgD